MVSEVTERGPRNYRDWSQEKKKYRKMTPDTMEMGSGTDLASKPKLFLKIKTRA